MGNSNSNPWDNHKVTVLGHDSDFIYIKCSSREATRLGAFYVKSKEAYKIPISKTGIDEREKVADIEILKNLQNKVDNFVKRCYYIKENKKPISNNTRLRNYQAIDVEFLKIRNSAAVFNEQRTGKTPTILSAIDSAGRGNKMIIVCPSGLKLNWQRELQTWIFRPSKVVTGTPKQREAIYDTFKRRKEFMVIIIGYETLRQDIDKLKGVPYDSLIVDEAHRLRNFKTKQSKAVYAIGKTAKYVYALTGTPAVNHPSDVFGILKLLRPTKFTSYWQFVERYFGYTEGRFGRELLDLRKDRMDEFTELLYTTSVQRKRRDVMQWIPKVTHRNIPLEISKDQTKYYNQILNEFRYEDNLIPNVITQLTRLRQVCLSPSLLGLNFSSPKAQFLKEYLEDNDETVLVFSAFTSFLKELKKLHPEAVMLTGEQTQAEKQLAVDKIQSGKARLMLSNIVAGGVGWTLDKVDTIIFLDKSFNPVDNSQAQDRFIPTRQDVEYGAKQIITLTMKDTIENKVEELLERKVNIIKFVNDYGLNELVNFKETDYNISAGLCHIKEEKR